MKREIFEHRLGTLDKFRQVTLQPGQNDDKVDTQRRQTDQCDQLDKLKNSFHGKILSINTRTELHQFWDGMVPQLQARTLSTLLVASTGENSLCISHQIDRLLLGI